MKIALISSVLPSGSKQGPGYQIDYLANLLVARGHNVTVYSRDIKPEGSFYDVITINCIGSLRSFKFMWEIAKIDFSSYDVIHTVGDSTFLFFNKGKTPVLRTYMGSSLAEALHIKKPKEAMRMFLLAIIEFITIFTSSKCVMISKGTSKYIPFVKEVVYCGVDTNIFKPGLSKSEKPSILFVGSLEWRKRGNMLVSIFKSEIKKAIPEAELWLVTKDSAEGNGIISFGRVTNEKLIELYQRAWVFCLPSTYEGFGVPYIEAMACGTPVVASRNRGAIEILEEGKYGILSADSDIGINIINLLSNENMREDYKNLGIQRCAAFSFNRIADQYEKLYIDLSTRYKRS
jgi:glycosyltransferase involved in cell wall biosynthesis